MLPPRPDDLTFELHWEPPSGDDTGWTTVSSWGEGLGRAGDLTGAGLEALEDTYVMCGPLAHHREGDISTWWLSTPAFDVEAFTTHLGATYRTMAEAFDAVWCARVDGRVRTARQRRPQRVAPKARLEPVETVGLSAAWPGADS